MSIASRLRNPKRPTPESGRPRLRGKTDWKPSPLDITEYQKQLHDMSGKSALKVCKTTGAFGGCTKAERLLKRIRRRFEG